MTGTRILADCVARGVVLRVTDPQPGGPSIRRVCLHCKRGREREREISLLLDRSFAIDQQRWTPHSQFFIGQDTCLHLTLLSFGMDKSFNPVIVQSPVCFESWCSWAHDFRLWCLWLSIQASRLSSSSNVELAQCVCLDSSVAKPDTMRFQLLNGNQDRLCR